jgi:glycine oxidase
VASFTHDVIILGQGLAGAVLFHKLHSRGLNVHAFDVPQNGSASSVAAGLVNPIALRRDVPTWRAHEMLAASTPAYEAIGERLGEKIWHPMPLVKIFPTPAETAQWQRAMQMPDTAPFLSLDGADLLQRNRIPAPHGHGMVNDCGWLDMRAFIVAHRQWLSDNGRLTSGSVDAAAITDVKNGVAIGAISAPLIIHCSGSFMEAPGLVPVKGEVLTVRIPGLELTGIIHRGVFLMPLGNEHFRVGSTYEWKDVRTGPTAQAQEFLLERLKIMLPDHEVHVVDHLAGVRPTSKDRRPILGMLRPHHAIFNGLGSRGAMLAPWCADHLIGHLFEGVHLVPEVGAARFATGS